MPKATKKTTKSEVKVKDIKPKKDPKGGGGGEGDINPQPLPPGHRSRS